MSEAINSLCDRSQKVTVGVGGSGELTEKDLRVCCGVMKIFCIFLKASSQVYKILKIH